MAEESTRSRLGRGLASLIGDMGAEANAAASERVRSQRRVPIEFLRPNPRNPRRDFSVAQRAGLHDVPVVVRDVSDVEALELAIVENVQREDLNPLEEAAGYQSLIDEFKYHQDEIAKVVGKSRSHVANTLRLLKLPEFVKSAIRSGQFSAGHARALIGHPEPERIARQIIERGLNVRQVEALARHHGKTEERQPRKKEADTIAREKHVSDALGLAVTVDHRNSGGAVHIKYRNLDQLRDIVRRLVRAP